MLPYFPQIYPDELLYSVLARYHRHTCSSSPKQTLGDLFGCRTVRATVDLPSHLGALCKRLPPDLHLSAERMVAEFTLFPYYVAFQPATVAQAVLTALIDGPADSVHVRLGIAASTIPAPRALRFCPACHAEAMAHWGEQYWHRAHQLPGVLVCPDHGMPLVESSVVLGLSHQHEFFAATDETCGSNGALPSWAEDEHCRTFLRDVAAGSVALLTMRLPPMSFEDLAVRYRQALIDRHFATARGRVDHDRLHHAFENFFMPVRAVLPALTTNEWLSAIARKHRHAFHPLCHILFGLFLDRYSVEPRAVPDNRNACSTNGHAGTSAPLFACRLRDLIGCGTGLRATARALGVDPNTVRLHADRLGLVTPWRPRCRPVHPRKPPPGTLNRDRWLAAQRGEPDITRTALAFRLPAEHIWLYRHDYAWLEAHSPAPAVRPPPRPRVDWASIDRDLSASLRRAADDLAQLIPPVRITRAELERRIGRSGWIGRRRVKLPEAVATMAAITESVEAFQIRRVSWATQEIEKLDRFAPVWRIRRLAGLPERASAAVEVALKVASGGTC